jgi:predicted unusual protein kinase regulating ubiquinone biosynthesis (AarF/ABC1/UbiB family)
MPLDQSLIQLEPIVLPRGHAGLAAARLAHISALGTRYFAPVAGRRMLRREGGGPAAARRLFERLGATYVKFGQFIASAPGIVGEDVAEEFRDCLDRGAPVAFADVRRTIESELGARLEDVFATFEDTPTASASIAVVHTATLPGGERVAVKVLRPGIEKTVATDLAIMERLSRFWAARGIDQMYNIVGLVVGLRLQIAEELDLRNEARTMGVFRGLYEDYGLDLLVVPEVHHQLTRQRVLTMEYLHGRPLDDLEHARSLGADPAPLVRELLKAWVLTGLRVGAFHADIHAGNLLLLNDGRLGMLDWGIIAQMDPDSRRFFRALCEASVGNEESWDEIAALMIETNGPSFYALGLTDEQIHNFARQTFEPVLTHPLQDVSMAELMMNGDDVVRRATGEEAGPRTLRGRWRSMRIAAQAYRTAAANGAFEKPSMRMGFLSMKQLVYLERYGRMYIPEEALLGDSDFVRRALDEPVGPVAAATG